jgi:hypothetical protein
MIIDVRGVVAPMAPLNKIFPLPLERVNVCALSIGPSKVRLALVEAMETALPSVVALPAFPISIAPVEVIVPLSAIEL